MARDTNDRLSRERQATVFACIRVRGESFAQLPAKFYKSVEDDEREEVKDHWAARLWKRGPVKDCTPFEYLEQISRDLDTDGNHFAYKLKVGGEIKELVPIPPADVTVSLDRATRRLTFKTTNFKQGGRDTFTRDEIFFVRRASRDGLRGMSPIEECAATIGTVVSAETHGRATFTNGAHPSGVLEYPETLDDEEYQRLQEDFDQNWNGERAGRTLILEGGAKFVPVAISNKDAQFLESRGMGRSEICGIFRVPPHKVADLTRSTNNNIEHQGLEWVTDGVAPDAARVESAWNSMPEMIDDPVYLNFLVDALVRGDLKSRMESYGKAIERGIMTPNEARRLENRRGKPGGNELMMMANVTSLANAVAAKSPTPTSSAADAATLEGGTPDDDSGDTEENTNGI